jgi:hypothetical protein
MEDGLSWLFFEQLSTTPPAKFPQAKILDREKSAKSLILMVPGAESIH